jgi:hypothetical protein
MSNLPKPTFLAAPSLSEFFQSDKMQTGIGYSVLVIGAIFLFCIIFGIIKVAPVAMAFWNRRQGIDEGTQASVGYMIGWLVLIIVPMILTFIVSKAFGSEISNAVITALKSIFS